MPSKKRKAKSKKRKKKQRAADLDNGDSSPVTTTTKSTRAELEALLIPEGDSSSRNDANGAASATSSEVDGTVEYVVDEGRHDAFHARRKARHRLAQRQTNYCRLVYKFDNGTDSAWSCPDNCEEMKPFVDQWYRNTDKALKGLSKNKLRNWDATRIKRMKRLHEEEERKRLQFIHKATWTVSHRVGMTDLLPIGKDDKDGESSAKTDSESKGEQQERSAYVYTGVTDGMEVTRVYHFVFSCVITRPDDVKKQAFYCIYDHSQVVPEQLIDVASLSDTTARCFEKLIKTRACICMVETRALDPALKLNIDEQFLVHEKLDLMTRFIEDDNASDTNEGFVLPVNDLLELISSKGQDKHNLCQEICRIMYGHPKSLFTDPDIKNQNDDRSSIFVSLRIPFLYTTTHVVLHVACRPHDAKLLIEHAESIDLNNLDAPIAHLKRDMECCDTYNEIFETTRNFVWKQLAAGCEHDVAVQITNKLVIQVVHAVNQTREALKARLDSAIAAAYLYPNGYQGEKEPQGQYRYFNSKFTGENKDQKHDGKVATDAGEKKGTSKAESKGTAPAKTSEADAPKPSKSLQIEATATKSAVDVELVTKQFMGQVGRWFSGSSDHMNIATKDNPHGGSVRLRVYVKSKKKEKYQDLIRRRAYNAIELGASRAMALSNGGMLPSKRSSGRSRRRQKRKQKKIHAIATAPKDGTDGSSKADEPLPPSYPATLSLVQLHPNDPSGPQSTPTMPPESQDPKTADELALFYLARMVGEEPPVAAVMPRQISMDPISGWSSKRRASGTALRPNELAAAQQAFIVAAAEALRTVAKGDPSLLQKLHKHGLEPSHLATLQRESESSLAALKVALASPNIKVPGDNWQLPDDMPTSADAPPSDWERSAAAAFKRNAKSRKSTSSNNTGNGVNKDARSNKDESVSKLLRVLGVGEDNPADILANQKIAEILANEPDTSLAVCTIGPGPVTPDDLHIFHRKPLESRRRLSSSTAAKVDAVTNEKNKGALTTPANAGKKITSDNAKTKAAKKATKTTAPTKTVAATKSKVGSSKSATRLTKSTLVITTTDITGLVQSTVASPKVDLGKSTIGAAKSQDKAVKSKFAVTKSEGGLTTSTGALVKPKAGFKSTNVASKQQVGVAKATVVVAKAKALTGKSTSGLAKPSAGMANSTITVADRHVRVVRPGAGVAKSTASAANSTAGVTASTVGVAKATVGSRQMVGACKQAKPNTVLPEKTVPVPKKKLDTSTNASAGAADEPDSVANFLDRWVFSVTFPIFILILVLYMLLVYKRIRLCSEIGNFILQLLD